MKKLIMAFGITLAIFVVFGILLNGARSCIQLGPALRYNDIKDDYQKVAEDYVKEKYGDHYKVIKSQGVFETPNIIVKGLSYIEFTFSDTRKIDNDFIVQVDDMEVVLDRYISAEDSRKKATEEAYQKVAKDYVKEKYGDHYRVAETKGMDSDLKMEFTFSDTENINISFIIEVQDMEVVYDDYVSVSSQVRAAEEAYQKIAEDYVKEKYGDHYTIIESEGVDSFWKKEMMIKFIFSDTKAIDDDFTVKVEDREVRYDDYVIINNQEKVMDCQKVAEEYVKEKYGNHYEVVDSTSFVNGVEYSELYVHFDDINKKENKFTVSVSYDLKVTGDNYSLAQKNNKSS